MTLIPQFADFSSGADARSMLWLNQVLLESVWDRDAAEDALQVAQMAEPVGEAGSSCWCRRVWCRRVWCAEV